MKKLDFIKKQIRKLKKTNKMYNRIYSDVDLNSVTHISDLPLIDKNDLREYYSTNNIIVDKKIECFHSTSGTTGEQLIIPYTHNDIKSWNRLLYKCFRVAKIKREDIVHISFGYGMWTAGIGFQRSLQNYGATVIPAGTSSIEKQIKYLEILKPTILVTSPFFARKITSILSEKCNNINLKKIICGSEPLSKECISNIKENLPVDVFNSYGLSECFGPGVAMSCGGEELHFWDDEFIFEIIDPISLQPVEFGKEGELVITTLHKEGLPLIRFNTHDITSFVSCKCKCGSRYPLIAPIRKRSDSLVKFKGVFLSESSIEAFLLEFHLGEYFQLIIEQDENKEDCAVLIIEYDMSTKIDLYSIKAKFKSKFCVSVEIKLVKLNTLHQEHSKLKKILDLR